MVDVNSSESIPASRMVDFQSSIKLYISNFVDFKGRSSRGAYWWAFVWLVIAGIVAGIADAILPGDPVNLILSLATIVPSLALGFRRLHDIGRSAWWLLIALTGIGILLLIFWYCQPGQRQENAYGPDHEAGVA